MEKVYDEQSHGGVFQCSAAATWEFWPLQWVLNATFESIEVSIRPEVRDQVMDRKPQWDNEHGAETQRHSLTHNQNKLKKIKAVEKHQARQRLPHGSVLILLFLLYSTQMPHYFSCWDGRADCASGQRWGGNRLLLQIEFHSCGKKRNMVSRRCSIERGHW